MAALNDTFPLTNTEECILPAAGTTSISEITPVPQRQTSAMVNPHSPQQVGHLLLLCNLNVLLCANAIMNGVASNMPVPVMWQSPPSKMAYPARPLCSALLALSSLLSFC